LNKKNVIYIYPDGSCNSKYKIGGWAVIIFFQKNKIILKGEQLDTTHNRMELLGALKALEYIKANSFKFDYIKIYSDSQYLVSLFERKEKLYNSNFLTKKGVSIQNYDLVKEILIYIDLMNIEFIKVKAHQKKSDKTNFNREVDKLSRKIVRTYVKENFS
jgi:ribonuclease HI